MNSNTLSNEHRFVREIHAIRLKIYDETKSMTPAERAARDKSSRTETEAALRRLGWKGGQ